MESGREEWRLVMTAEGDWMLAEGMGEWCNDRAKDARRDFYVMKARLSKDRQSVWMVCDPHTSTYSARAEFRVVCGNPYGRTLGV